MVRAEGVSRGALRWFAAALLAGVPVYASAGQTLYEYDVLGRLTRAAQDDVETVYNYDAAGNRTEYIRRQINYWGNPNDATQWASGGLSVLQSGAIDGAPAFRFSVLSAGQTGYFYTPSQGVAAGGARTFAISVQAVAAVTAHYVGLAGDNAFGANGLSTAQILSGPGGLIQVTGGLWKISGLSTTQPTRVSVTRNSQAAEQVQAYFYVGDTGGLAQPGDAVLVAGPTLNAAPANRWPALADSNQWPANGGLTRAAASTIDGLAAFKLTVQASGPPASVYSTPFSRAAGQTTALTASLMAVGANTANAFGIAGDNAWGLNADSTAAILSGPGTLSQSIGGLWRVQGLSTTVPTRVSVVRTSAGAEAVQAYIYVPDCCGTAAANAAIIVGNPVLIMR